MLAGPGPEGMRQGSRREAAQGEGRDRLGAQLGIHQRGVQSEGGAVDGGCVM